MNSALSDCSSNNLILIDERPLKRLRKGCTAQSSSQGSSPEYTPKEPCFDEYDDGHNSEYELKLFPPS